MNQITSVLTKVVLSKGETPKDCVINGIDRLGGISEYINHGDQVFIKFNLCLPYGFPNNTNIDTIEAVILLCKQAGAKKIFLGSFPFNGIPIKAISDSLGLQSYFQNLHAELAFLDNSDYFLQKNMNINDLRTVKRQTTSHIKIDKKEFDVPKIIVESNKLISINQVNADPLFGFRTSIHSAFSMVSNKNQDKYNSEIRKTNDLDTNYRVIISNIVDVFRIKKPQLVINDIFYVMEGAGPYVYRDSNLNKTSMMILGNDAIAVDSVLIELFNLNGKVKNLLQEASKQKLGISDFTDIQLLGENIKDNKLSLKIHQSRLEDLQILNLSIKSGLYNLLEYQQAYHFLNFIKTHLIKDLKYTMKTSFLIGINPPEPDYLDTIIIYGDNAISSTNNREFRRTLQRVLKKTKIKKNPRILELPGNPPDFFDSLDKLYAFFGKKELPNLNFIQKVNNLCFSKDIRKNLEIWEGLT